MQIEDMQTHDDGTPTAYVLRREIERLRGRLTIIEGILDDADDVSPCFDHSDHAHILTLIGDQCSEALHPFVDRDSTTPNARANLPPEREARREPLKR